MAESSNGLLLQQNHIVHSLHAALDPRSLILSQFPDTHEPQFLQLSTDSFIMERGSRYKEYSELRNKRLRMKSSNEEKTYEELCNRSILTPTRKQVKFNSNFTTPPRRPKGSSVLTQSVPDFSSALRKEKENRKPTVALPPLLERSTPPAGLLKSGKMYDKLGVGSKSTNSAEKKSGGMMARKSYASLEELKGSASAARRAINSGGRNTVLGLRKF